MGARRPLRLAQAIGNLVANACEHGRGPVVVSVRAQGRRVQVEVADRGPGLPAALEKSMGARRPFPRRRGRDRLRGHGMGIAAAVAADMGGRLLCAPAPVGARLVLDLPLLVHHAPASAPQVASAAAGLPVPHEAGTCRGARSS